MSAYDFNLAAGLRETLALLSCDDTDALLVLYDVPPPPPLHAKRPVAHPVAVALLLTRVRTAHTIAHLALCEAGNEDTMQDWRSCAAPIRRLAPCRSSRRWRHGAPVSLACASTMIAASASGLKRDARTR